jgi:leucyl aminopeptidase
VWNLKTDKKKEEPTLLVGSKDAQAVKDAAAIAKAICRTRDLIHTPANIKTPAWMGKQAEEFAKGTGLKVEIFAGVALKEFGGLRAVGGSSPKPGPRMIQVSYQPKSKKKSAKALPHVVLVGKGITFDTGGVSLKRPYDTMMAMKSDMAGSAAILGTLTALEELQPNVRVTALMMMAENAISATAQRPSDVIKHYGGTTVEVINTDAEGRLVLADGLAYADAHLDPDYLIDIATLTGAATLGLGRQYAAMYTRDNSLAAQLSKAGDSSGDRVWHMPLVDDYKEALRSDIADLNHTADKGKFSAGSVTAALFLENFTSTRRWVHLDIAGTARSEVDAGENSKGGTGFGVRLLTEWITSLS